MKKAHLLLAVLTAILATACASKSATTEISNTPAPAAQTSPDKTAPAKDTAKKDTTKKDTPVAGAIIGKPTSGSKFAKLKIGMTSAQVNKLIGPPTKQWKHPTGKSAIPFYFGTDRWALQYSYKSEGVLTFNAGGDQLLTRVEVNKYE